ncbi:stress response translation initiation inhibitor YciH [Ferrimonas aestuarii]|uniref:stress response translation initiation inhibitor YciH n=1 Tax=Ferrimonas aestuarii TaxID=2569539 RepID=UPI00197ABC25|nr:stress response translation initiation inhibitor YciH [Ferrimonas aestuarii]
MISNHDSQLVYSTDQGRIDQEQTKAKPPEGDGWVRIHLDRKGRKGKGMMVIKGLGLEDKKLKKLAATLKKKMGVGGAVKEFDIEIQGDKRDQLKQLLEQQGFKVKLAGG